MTINETNYRAKGCGTCDIYTDKTTNGYMVTTHWPAGVQDFPDVRRTSVRSKVAGLEREARQHVESLGFVQVN